MKKHFFITGTDTEVGKTLVSLSLLSWAADRGYSTGALKPVAAGCTQDEGHWHNDDALALQSLTQPPQAYADINPIALPAPVAPHLAALEVGQALSLAALSRHCEQQLDNMASRFVVVEGAGGWRVPLNDTEFLSGLPQALQLPVILVVGMRLGCLNHAILSAEAIQRDGLHLAGWLANQVDPNMPLLKENIATLNTAIPAPCLGHIPYLHKAEPSAVIKYLDIDKISV